jgi:type I restriction enzyme S subunit
MSGTLEEMAQAIFNHWFVDFEFPDKNGKPYKSSGGKMKNSDGRLMPVMWEQKKLGNTLSLLKDGSHNPPKRVNEGIRFIAGASDVEHFDIDFSKCTYISKEDCAKIHKYFELKENDALLTIVGTVGNVAIVKKSDLPFSLQRSIAILRAGHEIEYSYLYLFLNTTEFKRYIASRLNVTAQPGIYLGTLSDAPIIVPPRDVMEKFHKIASEIISSMQKNSIENRTLSSLRDSLLPKLMSGEIRVEGI